MKRALCIFLAVPALSFAQSPDVVVRLDVNPNYQIDSGGVSRFRWYDPLGKHSTVGISMILEPGFRLLVTERLQRMPGDDDQLDEWYLEDEGNWRVGKQYLPFGRQGILRESALAARVDTNLVIEGLPIALAACDAGPGRQRGLTGRLGGRIGLSFAVGSRFGAQGTSLGVVRDPDLAPGEGRGYRQVIGLDFWRRLGSWRVQGEAAFFRAGQTSLDKDMSVTDLQFSQGRATLNTFTLGWSRDWAAVGDIYRAQAHVLMARSLWLEPILRFKGDRFFDFAVSLRAKL